MGAALPGLTGKRPSPEVIMCMAWDAPRAICCPQGSSQLCSAAPSVIKSQYLLGDKNQSIPWLHWFWAQFLKCSQRNGGQPYHTSRQAFESSQAFGPMSVIFILKYLRNDFFLTQVRSIATSLWSSSNIYILRNFECFHIYTNEILYEVYILFESDIEEKMLQLYFED